jgi:hypothetical protein
MLAGPEADLDAVAKSSKGNRTVSLLAELFEQYKE